MPFPDLLHQGDRERAEEVLRSLPGGGEVGELRCRVRSRGRTGVTLTFSVATEPQRGRIHLLASLEETSADGESATLDSLTGLPNRAMLLERSERILRDAEGKGLKTAFLFVDLNKFKPVNDTHGHAAGDLALKTVGERLTASVRGDDMAARLGGDEFVVVASGLRQTIHASLAAKRLLAALARPIEIGGGVEVEVGASVGISVFPDNGTDVLELLQGADEAMYALKRTGRQGYVFAKTGGGEKETA
jgi:diguanylate cyclase (GGDEF)-like protein